ncbi:MAG TPA: hypothetical protein VL001_02060 [Candidimonas sp.]|nr:hypothetical protein [Candidimonas sp.]
MAGETAIVSRRLLCYNALAALDRGERTNGLTAMAKRLAKIMRVNVLSITDAWSVRERRVIYREFDALPACAKKLLELLVERSREATPS